MADAPAQVQGDAGGQGNGDQEVAIERSMVPFQIEPHQDLEIDLGHTFLVGADVRIGNGYAEEAPGGEATNAPAPQTRQVIVVNLEGGTYVAGPWPDDSLRRRSWLVGQFNHSSVTFAPYGTEPQKQAVFQEMQDLFARYGAEVTRTRPASGSFIDCVITGSPASMLGCGCGGIAPMSANCALIPTAIVFTFGNQFGSPRRIAEVAAQEVGHAIGLDHELLCQDPMSYLQCGRKSFQDRDVPCGESSARRCACGGFQNSHRELLRKLGPAGPQPPGDATIRFLKPENDNATIQGNTWIEISVEVDDPQGVAEVELIWNFTHAALKCSDHGNGHDWSCTHDPATRIYTWKLDVGTGDRTYRIRVTDSNGSTTLSPSRVIHLTRDTPPPCPQFAVMLRDPISLGVPARQQEGDALRPLGSDANPLMRGQSYAISAVVPTYDSQTEIREVHVIWLDPDGFGQTPMQRDPLDKTLWKLNVHVPDDAILAHRRFCIRASTFRGEILTTEHATIYVG
jgi:hypothetical protein